MSSEATPITTPATPEVTATTTTAESSSENNSNQKQIRYGKLIPPNSFEPDRHFYPKAINAQVSSIVAHFMTLGIDRIITRYCHLNPKVDEKKLRELLTYKPTFFFWSGADLFNCTNQQGNRKMVLIETNSCPSGQKSMPLLAENDEHGSYRTLLEKTFKHLIEEKAKAGLLPEGRLAVVYDKNPMEATGYAATLADVFKEDVLLVEYYNGDKEACVRFNEKQIMEVKDAKGVWHPVRAAFRYLTQKPWNRLPLVNSKTVVLNPIVTCLSGGRNKLVASKAYDFLNADIMESGLKIIVPKTIRDISLNELPLWVSSLGGFAVIKNPYSNAGQGVWTITTKQELSDFIQKTSKSQHYDQFIVQQLIGNSKWSSNMSSSGFYHIGTVPDKHKNIYAADLRIMIHYNYEDGGFAPLAMYARRATLPLTSELGTNRSWDILGTNLSVKNADGSWDTDTKRLIIADRRDFNRLGLGVDDLIDGYIQTVLATVAIDKLAKRLTSKEGGFNMDLFGSLDRDETLLKEILL